MFRRNQVRHLSVLLPITLILLAFYQNDAKADPDYVKLQGSAKAIDADTLEFGTKRIDLWGADGLERFQKCVINNESVACGQLAWQMTTKLLSNTPITCYVRGKNRYHRNMAICKTANGTDIGKKLIASGLAVARPDETPEYTRTQDEAMSSGNGAWAGRFIDPLKWRRGERLPEHRIDLNFQEKGKL